MNKRTTVYPDTVPTPDVTGLEYLSADELIKMARSGSLRADTLLLDVDSGAWVPASEWPELRQCFAPPRVNWPAIGLLALGAVVVGALCESVGGAINLSWEELRLSIFRRDRYRCVYCGRRGTARTLHVDHKLPVCRSGSDDPGNLVTACGPCNQRKGARTAFEFRLAELFG
jgi:HNH endonuclease